MKRSKLFVLLLGFVALPAFAVDRIFTGTLQLTKDTYFQYGTITLDNCSIVTNGYRLTLEGTSKIVSKGTPRIVSFEPRNMKAGETGRNAGILILKTPTLMGTTVRVDNVGENGGGGSPGAAGSKGSKGGQGTQRDWNAWNGCIGGSNGGAGGPGGDGTDGGNGGSGGSGGPVVLDIVNGCWNGGVPRLEISVSGGAAGAGGVAGAAGLGGDGGDGAPGTFYCGGTSPGPSGPAGRAGRVGPSGSVGNPGPIFDVRQTCSPKGPMPEKGSLGFGLSTLELKNPQ